MSVDEKRAAKFVCLGGGVAAGYWASTLAAEAPTLQAGGGGGAKPFALIVSAEPAGLAPYERSEVSKSLLDPDRPALRRLGAGSALPFAPSLAAGEIAGSAEPHAPAWYADKGVELMHSCVCVAADLDKKRLTLRTYAPGDYGGA